MPALDDADLPGVPPGMAPEVAGQIVADLARGPKVLSTLATAAHLIAEARNDETGLRLAESAAYNLREALDAVVVDQTAGSSGMPAVKDALERYRAATADPEAGEVDALRGLADDLLRLDTEGELLGHRSRQFLTWLEARTGIKPLPGDDDPNGQFGVLRSKVNTALHDSSALPLVAGYYDEAIRWFTRVFTPPDDRVRAIVDLARTPFTGPSQIVVLRQDIAYNAHHLVRFLSEVQDPAWLDALCDEGLSGPPRSGEPWPVAALVGTASSIDPAHTVALFERIRTQASTGDPEAFAALDRDLMQLCFRLGPSPDVDRLITTIVRKRPADHWVQRLAVHAAREAEPSADLQVAVADAVIGNDSAADASYQTRTMATLLVGGLDESNVGERMRLLALKLAKLAGGSRAMYRPLGTAALNTPDDEDDLRDEIVIVAERFTSAIPAARALGFTTDDLLGLVASIPGEVGGRVGCRILVGASDATREMKLAQLRARLASSTATGDDRDLLADIGDLTPDDIAELATEFGEPTPAPLPETDGVPQIPADWLRAWRWSVILPPEVLAPWAQEIKAVTERYGSPDEQELDRRPPVTILGGPESPYTAEQLSGLPPLDAAELVATWRIEPDTGVWGTSIYELATVLETTIAADIDGWTEDPLGIVTALREPAYIQRYLRVLKNNAKQLTDRISPIMETVELIRTEPWVPAQLTRDEVDPDIAWSGLDRPILELIAALANAEADFGEHLGLAWDTTEQHVRDLPGELPPLPETHDPGAHDDAYGRAINRTYGQALETAVTLGWLGNRRDQTPPTRFTDILDWVLTVPGSVGAELRSVVAVFRPVLESSARVWLDQHHRDLFGGDLGRVAFEATLKYPRAPTPWLYANYKDRIAEAALDGVPTAVALPLLGYLWEVDGITPQSIIGSYKRNTDVLRQTASEVASLVQDIKADDPILGRALAFWDGMLDAAGTAVPPEALAGAGRWAFVSAVTTADLIDRLDRTTQATGGVIDLVFEVANQFRDAQPSAPALRVLTRMQGHGEPWEKEEAGRVGLEALARAAGHGLGPEFHRLRDRLIELGFHDAASIHDELA